MTRPAPLAGYRWLRRWRGTTSHLVSPEGVALCGAIPTPGKAWEDDAMRPACPRCERKFHAAVSPRKEQ